METETKKPPCLRCKEERKNETDKNCWYCGVGYHRAVKRIRRRARVGGKRGRNSGSTNKSKAG